MEPRIPTRRDRNRGSFTSELAMKPARNLKKQLFLSDFLERLLDHHSQVKIVLEICVMVKHFRCQDHNGTPGTVREQSLGTQ